MKQFAIEDVMELVKRYGYHTAQAKVHELMTHDVTEERMHLGEQQAAEEQIRDILQMAGLPLGEEN